MSSSCTLRWRRCTCCFSFQVIPQQQTKIIRPKPDSIMVLTILNSAPLTVLVPADLEVDDPAFIQYAAQEALTIYKRTTRGIGPASLVAY